MKVSRWWPRHDFFISHEDGSPLVSNSEVIFAMIDQKKIALIHIIKGELHLSDEEYRDLLKRAVGVRSSKDLDEKTFRALMRYFVRSRHYVVNKVGLTIKQKLFIRHLVVEAGWDKAHFENFLMKIYSRAKLEDLSRLEAQKVIVALMNMQRHAKASSEYKRRKEEQG